MARSVRIEYGGAFYHVMARGNRREAIFLDDDDRRFFLQALSEACEKTGWRVHAWVLMGNHYHLFIETPEANLAEGMKWLQNTVTRRFNIRHRQWGRTCLPCLKFVLYDLLTTLNPNPVKRKTAHLWEVHRCEQSGFSKVFLNRGFESACYFLNVPFPQCREVYSRLYS